MGRGELSADQAAKAHHFWWTLRPGTMPHSGLQRRLLRTAERDPEMQRVELCQPRRTKFIIVRSKNGLGGRASREAAGWSSGTRVLCSRKSVGLCCCTAGGESSSVPPCAASSLSLCQHLHLHLHLHRCGAAFTLTVLFISGAADIRLHFIPFHSSPCRSNPHADAVGIGAGAHVSPWLVRRLPHVTGRNARDSSQRASISTAHQRRSDFGSRS